MSQKRWMERWNRTIRQDCPDAVTYWLRLALVLLYPFRRVCRQFCRQPQSDSKTHARRRCLLVHPFYWQAYQRLYRQV